jgi:hypothetical protein
LGEKDILCESITISLIDDLYFNLIETPARGRFCKHPKVFSLENFIEAHKN